MKNGFVSLLVAGLLAGGAAWAEDSGEDMATCAQYAELAKLVMELRQMGGSLQRVLGAVEAGTWSETIVLSAWERPRVSTESVQRRIVQDFVDEVYLTCIRVQGRD